MSESADPLVFAIAGIVLLLVLWRVFPRVGALILASVVILLLAKL